MQNRSIRFMVILEILLSISSYAVCEDRTEEAKALFRSGVASFKAGSYIEAANAFRKANEIKPNWSLLFNIAQCETAAKRYGLAYEAFEDYFAKGGDDLDIERRELVKEEIENLKKLIGTLEIKAPKGATVTVDGVHRGTTLLPGRLKIAVGMIHTVEIHQKGSLLHSEKVKVSQGERIRIEVAAPLPSDKEDEAPSEVETAQPQGMGTEDLPKDSKPPKIRIIGWTGIGVGASLLIAGAVTGGIALSMNNELEEACPSGVCPAEKRDRKETKDALMISCDVLWATGAVAGGVGIGLLIWSYRSQKKNETQHAVSVTPVIGRSSAGLTLSGRF